MILLDSDVMIDLLHRYPPATRRFDALDEDEEIALSGYVGTEWIQGCKNMWRSSLLRRLWMSWKHACSTTGKR